MTDALTFRSEAWWGANLGDFRGGIGSTINTTTGQEVHAVGGWAELVWQANDATRLYAGAATDNPDGGELATGRANENFTAYVGTRHQWGSGLITAFDALYWETHWKDLPLGNALRFNLYFQYNF